MTHNIEPTTDTLDEEQLLNTLMAFRRGDFTVRMSSNHSGRAGRIADTLNDILENMQWIDHETMRVKKEVGKQGKLDRRITVPKATGSWQQLSLNINELIEDLVYPTTEITRVIRLVAKGDLTEEVETEISGRKLKGEFLRTAQAVNTMVNQLAAFAREVTRVAREVGTEGKLGGQAKVRDIAGTWKDLTDSVNMMAGNLTNQVRNIAMVTTAVANGDLSQKITVDAQGEVQELKDTINVMVGQLRSFASEVTRVAREVGIEGKLGGQARVEGVSGTWKDLTDNVNMLAANLTTQVRNIANVTTAVANGDLSRKITVDANGEILELKITINTMVDQLRSFASEVTRVAREVGVQGKLGGQAKVEGVSGTWKYLTDNVNMLANNLTTQVRNIANVTTAVANGDLSKKITVDVEGEIRELKNTINNMVDQLRSFASEVTRVAREVGVQGKLGGQAHVTGISGTWKDLTDNVNQLALSLTSQLRAIATVSTAVAEGDLSHTINIRAAGEVEELKNNINQMIMELRETSRQNTEQDWLKTNLANFTRRLQGERDILQVTSLILSELAPIVNAHQGLFYILDDTEDEVMLRLIASYAIPQHITPPDRFRLGETIIGQAAIEKKRITLKDIPQEFIQIQSGLGMAQPTSVIVLPVLFENELKAVVELASFQEFTPSHLALLDQLMESVAIVLNTIQTNMRTEQLLKQSQQLAMELQMQQRELQQTNAELEEKASQLVSQNEEVERKNQEVELAKKELEEKAEQLAFASKYKSEFLANMSHELRTPLNSLLILSRQLAENMDGNLTPRQIEYASTINSAGSDLLSLINDILDLSKIESGTVSLDLSEITFTSIHEFVERTFKPIGEAKNLPFVIQIDPHLPATTFTDKKRLTQVLKNLLANAFKFTDSGQVTLQIQRAQDMSIGHHPVLAHVETVIAYVVRDTGIGIPLDKQQIIFEAFQQAEGATNRQYGGTGLGLSISREIATMLGGEIQIQSTPGQGSTFTLFLPLHYVGTPETIPPQPPPREHPTPATLRMESKDIRTSYTPSTRAEYLRQVGVELTDDRQNIQPDDHVMLIIEDDPSFAKILLEVAHEQKFKGLVANRGDSGIALAHGFHPDVITLDIHLPDVDGWTVLERIKADPATRHIPIIVISVDEDKSRGIKRGAHNILVKPVSKKHLDDGFRQAKQFIENTRRSLLIIEDDDNQRAAIRELVSGDDIQVTDVADLQTALDHIREQSFDCIILDLLLPGVSGFEALEQLQKHPNVHCTPIIIYTGKDLSHQEEMALNELANSVIIKDVRSPERLLYETTLFLHRPYSTLSPEKQKMLNQLHDPITVLNGKHALIVDDDPRNIFALRSLLERNNMRISSADSAKAAIEFLKNQADVDVILMDIMMPEMDGYQATRQIRKLARYKTTPVIAVTAKAMRGDREKTIEAGASDYITKPVDAEQLLNMLRIWLHR